ncbi:MAG: hypothetical protein FJ264_11540 [Planctomycetes bacterium]|nr:hypothetical protein [Planctomycetota bacterium]
MTISDELYDMIKLFRTTSYKERGINDLHNPANLWCMWIRKDSRTWKKFVVWYLEDSLEILGKRDCNFWDYFASQKSNIKEFAKDWVADEERNDFYKFCIRKMKSHDLQSKIHTCV